MVSHVLDAAREAGFERLVAVVPPADGAFREAICDPVSYAVQASPLGSGDALLSARSALPGSGTVAVLCGDVPLVRPDSLQRMRTAHDEAGAKMTLLTATVGSPAGLGRIVRGRDGGVEAVVEEADADPSVLAAREVNAGVYLFDAEWLWEALGALSPSGRGEVYLTGLVAAAAGAGGPVVDVIVCSEDEAMGVNDRLQLARAEGILRSRIRERWMLAGVAMPDPGSVYIDAGASLGEDTVILPNTHVLGSTRVGRGCVIGPNSVVEESDVGDDCRIVSSFVSGSRVSEGASVGPFSNIREGTVLESGARVGNFTETKQSRLGAGTRALHLSYIGDADVGADVNVGAGTITCNFDGKKKGRTTIGDGAFIGSDTMLIAPVTVGAGASVGAGSVVTRDIAAGDLVVGAPARPLRRERSGEDGQGEE